MLAPRTMRRNDSTVTSAGVASASQFRWFLAGILEIVWRASIAVANMFMMGPAGQRRRCSLSHGEFHSGSLADLQAVSATRAICYLLCHGTQQRGG
jgi:hypothetical protein